MELYWTHNLSKNYLECNISDNLYYRAFKGGKKIKKYIDDKLVDVFAQKNHDDPWEDEKNWISQFYSDTLGAYEPKFGFDQGQQHEWKINNNWDDQEFPMFGVSKTGEYLDRLQRPTSKQTGTDMITVLQNIEFHIMVEKDTEGNYWQRPFCTEQDTFYNVQPCCVFPENPGRKLLLKDEALRLIDKYSNYSNA